nr:MAG TPA: IGLE PROTEIN, BACTERIAL SECRETION SYSTEM [Caudoviricetes sp.]
MRRTIPSRIVSFAGTIRCKVYALFFVLPMFRHGENYRYILLR